MRTRIAALPSTALRMRLRSHPSAGPRVGQAAPGRNRAPRRRADAPGRARLVSRRFPRGIRAHPRSDWEPGAMGARARPGTGPTPNAVILARSTRPSPDASRRTPTGRPMRRTRKSGNRRPIAGFVVVARSKDPEIEESAELPGRDGGVAHRTTAHAILRGRASSDGDLRKRGQSELATTGSRPMRMCVEAAGRRRARFRRERLRKRCGPSSTEEPRRFRGPWPKGLLRVVAMATSFHIIAAALSRHRSGHHPQAI